MAYSLNGTSLESLGFIAGQQTGSNIALTGFLDMPSRLGKTHHVWAEGKGLQPYVGAGEIRFGGRDLKVTGYFKETDRSLLLAKDKALTALVDGITTLVPLVTDWGTFNVYVVKITSQLLHETILQVNIEMREPLVNLTGTLPSPDNGEFGIDGYSFSQLGGFLTKFNGERYGRAGTKEQNFTSWQHEGYQITKRGAPTLDFELFVQANNYALFEGKIRALYKLLGGSGTRIINVVRDQFREFFVTDGFAVNNIQVGDVVSGLVSFKGVQVYSDFYFLTANNGDYITDNSNNKILIK